MGRLRLEDIHLDELYITGGMKTDAGKNRMVPIHSRIVDLVRKNYENAQSLGREFLLNVVTYRMPTHQILAHFTTSHTKFSFLVFGIKKVPQPL